MANKNEHFVVLYDTISRSGLYTPNEIAVYSNLLSHQGTNEKAWPSQTTIGREVTLNKKTVGRTIKSLVRKGLVTVKYQFDESGRQTTNAYYVHETPLRGTNSRPPLDRKSHKGDSIKGNSLINTPSETVSERWVHLSHELPPTEKQMEYIRDLVMEFEGCDEEDANELVDDLAIDTQVDADDLIRMLYVAIKNQAEKGHSFGFTLADYYPGGYPLPSPEESIGAISTHTPSLNGEATPCDGDEEEGDF